MSRGEEEAGVGGEGERSDGLGVAVDGVPDGGGVGGGHHAQVAAAGAREEGLCVAVAAGSACPDGEGPARVELLQRAVAAVVLLGPLRQSHGGRRRSHDGFCGGGGGGGARRRTRV